MAYAENTTVPVAKTRGEIEALLAKFKCTQFVIGSDSDSELRRAMVQFKAHNRLIRFTVALPDPTSKEVTQQPGRSWKRRTTAQVQTAIEQIERQRWRALMLVIKAKLESVESKIATFEEEFLAHIIMPNGQTVSELVLPHVAESYRTGQMSQGLLLPAVGETTVTE